MGFVICIITQTQSTTQLLLSSAYKHWVFLFEFSENCFIYSSNGEEWRQQRKILAKILMGAVQMNRYVPVINKVSTGDPC